MKLMQLFRVLVPAFTQPFSPENIRKGFQQTGIYPIDPAVAKLKDLGPSIITDKCKTINIIITLCLFQICWSFSFLGEIYGKQVGEIFLQQVGHNL